MKSYLGCLKKVGGMNDNECRNIAKSYLACRMERFETTSTLTREDLNRMEPRGRRVSGR